MIPEIIKLLQSNEWLGVSENVELAKGKYEVAKTFKQTKYKIKRALWLSNKQ